MISSTSRTIFIFVLILGFISCTNKPKQYEVEGKIVSEVDKKDTEMNMAINKANKSFDDFKNVFIENKRTQKYHSFTIKMAFQSEKYEKEHMWLDNLKFDNNTFIGILCNIPLDKTISYKQGDTIIVDPELVSDWMYIDKETGIAHGGYTYKVLRGKMSLQEQETFDKKTGLKFE